MILKNGDFIEVEFTGKVKGGEVFDSNIKGDLKQLDSNSKLKPFVFCLGKEMFLKGVEDFLAEKEIGNYEIELSPEKAFGTRDSSLIKIIPAKVFKENKLNPLPGTMFNFDGKMAKILTVSGGRVITDFNNPLAGKTVIYKIRVLRKVSDINEKAKALIEFLFRKDLTFRIEEKRIIIDVEKNLVKFVELFKEKFKDILGLDLEVKETTRETNENLKEEKEEKETVNKHK